MSFPSWTHSPPLITSINIFPSLIFVILIVKSFHPLIPSLCGLLIFFYFFFHLSNFSIFSSAMESDVDADMMNRSCIRMEIMGSIVSKSAPYLYPFIIEYSLISACVLFIMWKHIGRSPKWVPLHDVGYPPCYWVVLIIIKYALNTLYIWVQQHNFLFPKGIKTSFINHKSFIFVS